MVVTELFGAIWVGEARSATALAGTETFDTPASTASAPNTSRAGEGGDAKIENVDVEDSVDEETQTKSGKENSQTN